MELTCLCPDCKAIVPKIDGPTHAYFGSNAGCWKIYGDILAKEYSDPIYMKVHRLTVDTYAAQHPGENEPRSAQSVNIHLVALYLILERKMSFEFATKVLGKLVEKNNHKFNWLTPPETLGPITITDVVSAKTPQDHAQKVQLWAESVWQAWHSSHRAIEDLARQII